MNLKYYLPSFYDDVVDMQELIDTEQMELNSILSETQNVFKQTFTDEMSQPGVERWESILNISPLQSQSLENRINAIKTKLYVKNKANFTFLQSVVEAYGTIFDIYFDNATSTVFIKFSELTSFSDVQEKIREIVPAHLLINLSYNYLLISEVQALTINQMQATQLENFSPFEPQL